MAQSYGAAVGLEQQRHSYDGDWGPTVNIMRTPLGGRPSRPMARTRSSTRQTAVGWIDGLQSQGVMATVKHFIENDQEGQVGASPLDGVLGGRSFTNVIVDQRTLHEIELEPFAAAVQQANVAAVMCSYNQVGGDFACDDPQLLARCCEGSSAFRA